MVRKHNRLVALMLLSVCAFCLQPDGRAQRSKNQQMPNIQTAPNPQASLDTALNKAVEQYGLDPARAQMMRSQFKQLQSQGAPQAARDIARQVRQSKRATSNAPPANFPAPVFKGLNTQYTVMGPLTVSAQQAQVTVNALTMTTSDSAAAVSAWYKNALPQGGWKLADPQARAREALNKYGQNATKLPPGALSGQTGLPPAVAAKLGIKSDELFAERNGMTCRIKITELTSTKQTMVAVSVSSR